MPIRIDEALNSPKLQPTALNMPQVRPEIAAAPARALGAVAEAVSGISDVFARKADQLQRLEDLDLTTKRKSAFEEGYAKQLQKSLSIHDSAERLKVNNQWLADNPPPSDGLSLTAAAELKAYYETASSRYRIEAGANAMREMRGSVVTGAGRRVKTQVKNGDQQGAMDTAEALRVAAIISDREYKAVIGKISEESARYERQLEADVNFIDFLERYSNGEIPEGVPAVEHQNNLFKAQEKLLHNTAMAASEILDEIHHGGITQIEDLETRAAGKQLRGPVKDILANELAELGRRESRILSYDRDRQNELIGRIAHLQSKFTPTANDADQVFAESISLIHRLPQNHPTRDHLIKINETLLKSPPYDHFQEAREKLDELFLSGKFSTSMIPGPPAERVAFENYGKVRSKFESWIVDNPSPDEAAIANKLYELVAPYNEAAVRNRITHFARARH
jgi:hypothetical protein